MRSSNSAVRRLAGAAVLGAASIKAMSLNLSQTYEGATFFEDWTYNASVIDNFTMGNVQCVQFELSRVFRTF